MKTLKEIRDIIEQYKEEIGREYNAEIVVVFGSYVRGEQTERSDVDLIVRFKEGATLFDFVGLAEFLEEKLNVKVDIVSESVIREELREKILKEAVVI